MNATQFYLLLYFNNYFDLLHSPFVLGLKIEINTTEFDETSLKLILFDYNNRKQQ